MIEFYPKSIYYPREAVEEKLAKGELQSTEKQLFGFALRHRDEIQTLAKEDESQPSDETLLDNLRAYILSTGTLNPAADMGNMFREISNEVWFQNEKKPISSQQVTEEWKKLYAQKWHEARIFEAFILIEHRAQELVAVLRQTESVQ